MPDYLSQVLEAMKPALARRIRYAYTGAPPPELDGIRAVVFWLADPLREAYPDCYADAVRIAEAARARDLHIVNAPEALSNSIKSVQAQRWREAGIPTVPVHRFGSRAELLAVLSQVPFPALLRKDRHHGQGGMRLVKSARAARRLPETALPLPGGISPLIDTREGHRGLWARLFHKKRLLVMGDVVRTVHTFFSPEPIVGWRTCTFMDREEPWRRPLTYLRFRRYHEECLRTDYEYWAQETAHVDLMRNAVRALGLEYAAIDYSDRADGTPVLWEANPYFDLPPWHANPLPEERRLEERHPGLHEAFAAFFRSLSGNSPPSRSA
jgi:hypothetical protein